MRMSTNVEGGGGERGERGERKNSCVVNELVVAQDM